jgi:hypothetical protein
VSCGWARGSCEVYSVDTPSHLCTLGFRLPSVLFDLYIRHRSHVTSQRPGRPYAAPWSTRCALLDRVNSLSRRALPPLLCWSLSSPSCIPLDRLSLSRRTLMPAAAPRPSSGALTAIQAQCMFNNETTRGQGGAGRGGARGAGGAARLRVLVATVGRCEGGAPAAIASLAVSHEGALLRCRSDFTHSRHV